MFLNFFFDLKQAQLPVSLKEYLMLMDAMDKRVISSFDVNDFYFLSRSALIKDERHLDKFDKVFGHSFKGLENKSETTEAEIPEEWLKLMGQKYLSDEEKKSYLKSQEWSGKAGGYSIQGAASYFFPFISGSYSNVVGLPLTETIGLLNGLGFKSPSFLNRSNN